MGPTPVFFRFKSQIHPFFPPVFWEILELQPVFTYPFFKNRGALRAPKTRFYLPVFKKSLRASRAIHPFFPTLFFVDFHPFFNFHPFFL